MTRTAITVAIAFAFSIAAYAAESTRGTKDEQEACTPDVQRLCSAEIPDEGRIVACLKKNKRNLSKACRKVFFDD